MQYALIDSNRIYAGPRDWHKVAFQVALEKLDININLPDSYIGSDPLVFGDYTIVAVQELVIPSETVTKQPAGPNYRVENGQVIGEYTLVDKSIESAKAFAKQLITNKRYTEEVSGTKVELQGHIIPLDTDRDSRDLWIQALYLLPEDSTQRFKFPGLWLDLSKVDLQTIVTAIMKHVQDSFQWESDKHAEIEGKVTLQELDAIEYRSPLEIATLITWLKSTIGETDKKRVELVNSLVNAQTEFDALIGTGDIEAMISEASALINNIKVQLETATEEEFITLQEQLMIAEEELNKLINAKQRLNISKEALEYHDQYKADLVAQLAVWE